MKGPAFWIDTKSSGSEINIPLGVGIIEKPVELQSYYVNIPVKKNDTSYIATMQIPISTNEGWRKLKDIHSFLTNNRQKKVTFHPLNMSLPNIINGYTQNRNSFKKNRKA